MARTRRGEVFDPDSVGVYHCFNRIVRRSFLCGLEVNQAAAERNCRIQP